MDKILNYKCTKHFEERIKERGLEKFLISLCLTKGKEQKEKKKRLYILKKEKIIDAIKQGYINASDYIGLDTLTIVVKSNLLITAYARYSDLGIGANL